MSYRNKKNRDYELQKERELSLLREKQKKQRQFELQKAKVEGELKLTKMERKTQLSEQEDIILKKYQISEIFVVGESMALCEKPVIDETLTMSADESDLYTKCVVTRAVDKKAREGRGSHKMM